MMAESRRRSIGPAGPTQQSTTFGEDAMRTRRVSGASQLSLRFGEEEMSTMYTLDEDVEHGEVFTRRWIVDLILDLAGFTPDRDLASRVVVEPSCGVGAFLVPIVERLIESCGRHDRPLTDIANSLRAFDLLPGNAEIARKAVAKGLSDAGMTADEAHQVSLACVRCDDFLLAFDGTESADFVLGNPPYIRLEDVPPARSKAYRRACLTMRGRSDVFVGFIEIGLRMLRPDGVLGFIVADRWMHNQYGSDLRQLVAAEFAVETVISMHDVDAFEERVSAYPAVTLIRRTPQRGAVVVSTSKRFDERSAPRLRNWIQRGRAELSMPGVTAARLTTWFDHDTSWPSGNPANFAVLADLERRFPALEDRTTSTRVGIGVASGADAVYLTDDPDIVEPDRLLPLLMTRDVADGKPDWSGTYLVNPWSSGKLVELRDYPRLGAYLNARSREVRGRHVAQTNPQRWYRTIDRVEPGLLETPKLVIPELKAFIQPVLDPGTTYPHHGLYFVTSDAWDLEVLGGLLLSDIAELFVSMYCVKMRGGCYRFQAQYLRRIRVPRPESIDRRSRRELTGAFEDRDRDRAGAIARRLYGLDAGLKVAQS
jgi:adenine-specific DNA-methyltransferase